MFLFTRFWDGQSDLAKAILKKVSLQRELTDGFQHPAGFLLQGFLLSLGFLLDFLGILEDDAGILQKLALLVAQHIGIYIVLICDASQLFFTLENLKNKLRFELRCVLFS